MPVIEFSRIQSADLPRRVQPLSLLFLLQGNIHARTLDGSFRIRAGELLVVRGDGHTELVSSRDGAEALCFRAQPEWLRQVLEASDQPLPPDDAGLCLEQADADLSRRARRLILAGLLDSTGGAPPGVRHTARALELVSIACSSRARLEEGASVGLGSPRRARFLRALEDLQQESLEELSLGAFATRLGVSERQASRLFNRELGTSFPAYLQSLRIERAKELLGDEALSVTEVGLSTGWQSLSHFNAVFRRRVGVTPSAYRALGSYTERERVLA